MKTNQTDTAGLRVIEKRKLQWKNRKAQLVYDLKLEKQADNLKSNSREA